MEKDLEKDVEESKQTKIKETQKFNVILIITILILLFILALIIKLANDNRQDVISVVENNENAVNNDEIVEKKTIDNEIINNEISQEETNSKSKLENELKNFKVDSDKEIIFVKDSTEYLTFSEGTGEKDLQVSFELPTINLKFKEIQKINSRIEEIYNENTKYCVDCGFGDYTHPMLYLEIGLIEGIFDVTINYNNKEIRDHIIESYHIDIENDKLISNEEFLKRLGIGKEELKILIEEAFYQHYSYPYATDLREQYEHIDSLERDIIFIKDKNLDTEKYEYNFDKICKISEISYIGDNTIIIDNIALPTCFGSDSPNRFEDKYRIGIGIDISKIINNKNKEIKYKPFNKEVTNNISNDEYIELIEIKDNKDNTVTLNFRKYKKVDVPKLTETQYNELIKNNEIKILNETFTYNPRANVLTNNNYVSFELDKENKKLVEYPMTILCTGTDEYYTTTCSSDLKVYTENSEDAFEKILQYAERRIQDDFNLLSISIMPEYVFNNKNELERINVYF